MQTWRPARELRASAAAHHHTFAAARPRIPAGVPRAAVGSLVSVALVVALVTAGRGLVGATDPSHTLKPPALALAVLAEVAAGDPGATGPPDPPGAPSTATRRVSSLLEGAFGARRRRRHLPLGAGFDAVVAITVAVAPRVLVAVAACKLDCWCGACSSSTAGRLASVCECG